MGRGRLKVIIRANRIGGKNSEYTGSNPQGPQTLGNCQIPHHL